jgi:hypothetical protein
MVAAEERAAPAATGAAAPTPAAATPAAAPAKAKPISGIRLGLAAVWSAIVNLFRRLFRRRSR